MWTFCSSLKYLYRIPLTSYIISGTSVPPLTTLCIPTSSHNSTIVRAGKGCLHDGALSWWPLLYFFQQNVEITFCIDGPAFPKEIKMDNSLPIPKECCHYFSSRDCPPLSLSSLKFLHHSNTWFWRDMVLQFFFRASGEFPMVGPLLH